MSVDKSATILMDFIKDSVGFVFDRTAKPERYLGQVSLIAPTQVATAASVICQYIDFPNALELRFPHPGLRFGVKSIHLHPGFNVRDAYNNYLSTSSLPRELPLLLPNDVAALTIEPELAPIDGHQIAQLNAKLVTPISVTGNDVSGTISQNDVASVLDVILATGRQGLLTLFDSQNRPYARLLIEPGRIAKAVCDQLAGEMGLFELVYKSRPGSFLFQDNGDFSFEGIADLSMQTRPMLEEAKRRAAEMPQVLASKGGTEGRYVRTVAQYDSKMINPNLHWVVERIWLSLDGYLTNGKLGERIGSDTYTALWGLHELANLGFVQPKQDSPFDLNGQLGAPIFGGLTLNVWDQILGFYLDPLSGRPIVQEGNFFGATPLKDSQVLLHTVAVPPKCKGAILVKENKIAGVHNGQWILQPGQAPPPATLYQMTNFNLLSDIGHKREMLEPPEPEKAPGTEPLEEEPTAAVTRSSMRRRMTEDLESPDEPDPAQARSNKLREMNSPNKLTKKQMLIGAGVLAAIALLLIIFGSNKPAPAPAPIAKTSENAAPPPPAPGSPEKAAETASKFANFSKFPPPGFVFEDTSNVTGDLPSFALVSERQNQKVMVVVWNNTGPVKDLSLILCKVPFAQFERIENARDLDPIQVDAGQSYVESDTMKWFVGRYTHSDDKNEKEMVLIGAYRHPSDTTKAIVVFARPFTNEGNFDYKTSLWLIDSMTHHEKTSSEESKSTQEAVPANGTKPNGQAGTTGDTTSSEKPAEAGKQPAKAGKPPTKAESKPAATPKAKSGSKPIPKPKAD